VVGSVDIEIGELLDRCKNNRPEPIASEPALSSGPTMRLHGTTLTLYDVVKEQARLLSSYGTPRRHLVNLSSTVLATTMNGVCPLHLQFLTLLKGSLGIPTAALSTT